MAFLRTPGICLRKIDFSETSQILRFFTRDHGKVSCIAKGAKRPKGSFRVPFDILSVYDLIRIEKRAETLDILTQAERLLTFPRLALDYPRFVAAAYAADFVDGFTQEGLSVEQLYERLLELLQRLETGVPLPDALYSFETRALRILGFLPRTRECGTCRREIRVPDAHFSVHDGGALCTECRPKDETWFPVRRSSLESLARFSEGDMPRERLRPALVLELRQILDACAQFHLERELKSAPILRRVLRPRTA